jgi:Tetratricopeptide repeat
LTCFGFGHSSNVDEPPASAQTAGAELALATAMRNLGRTHLALDRFDDAADHVRRAQAIFKKVGDRLGEADSTIELGFVLFQEKADYDAPRRST